jgi:aminoglycoside 6'-N-acetyltransferase
VIEFRPIEPEDVVRLAEWLDREHVKRWWRDERAEDYLDPNEQYVIEVDARPVGMIQTYRVDDYPGWKEVVGDDPGLAGLDLLIGEEDLVGRGLGPRVIEQFARQVVFADLRTAAVVATVEEPNRRSWRAFEKAGFRHVRNVVEDGLPHRLMRLDRR